MLCGKPPPNRQRPPPRLLLLLLLLLLLPPVSLLLLQSLRTLLPLRLCRRWEPAPHGQRLVGGLAACWACTGACGGGRWRVGGEGHSRRRASSRCALLRSRLQAPHQQHLPRDQAEDPVQSGPTSAQARRQPEEAMAAWATSRSGDGNEEAMAAWVAMWNP
jgi:hypothetical protein